VYEFAIVVLLGIGTFKLVDMVDEYLNLSKIATLFTIGLAIAGGAPSMEVLVGGRFIQGLGTGVIPPVVPACWR